MALHPRINIDPAIMGGKPVIKGRRVTVHVILACLAGGDDVATVCDQFDLTEEDVRAALAFAAALSDKSFPTR